MFRLSETTRALLRDPRGAIAMGTSPEEEEEEEQASSSGVSPPRHWLLMEEAPAKEKPVDNDPGCSSSGVSATTSLASLAVVREVSLFRSLSLSFALFCSLLLSLA